MARTSRSRDVNHAVMRAAVARPVSVKVDCSSGLRLAAWCQLDTRERGVARGTLSGPRPRCVRLHPTSSRTIKDARRADMVSRSDSFVSPASAPRDASSVVCSSVCSSVCSVCSSVWSCARYCARWCARVLVTVLVNVLVCVLNSLLVSLMVGVGRVVGVLLCAQWTQ